MVHNGMVSNSTMWCRVVLDGTRAGCRVRGVNLVDVVPRTFVLFLYVVFVFVVVFVVFLFFFVVDVLGFLTSAVLLFTGGDDLDPSRVLVSEVVVVVVVVCARVVVDNDSLP